MEWVPLPVFPSFFGYCGVDRTCAVWYCGTPLDPGNTVLPNPERSIDGNIVVVTTGIQWWIADVTCDGMRYAQGFPGTSPRVWHALPLEATAELWAPRKRYRRPRSQPNVHPY